MRKALTWGSGIGAAAMYFFDPEMGRTRRAKLQDRVAGLFRRSAREAARKAEYARGHVEGLRHLATPESPPENDQVLTAKVESEILSRWNYPKGQISVNSVDGVVELRGMCDTDDQIRALEGEVRGVTGVIDVHNFLHLPDSPAPNKEEALNRS